jgi:hypothetical protein
MGLALKCHFVTIATLEAHNFLCRLMIDVTFETKLWPLSRPFQNMWHATFMQVSQGYYWFLVVWSQIGNLTPSLSFGHNLCFKHQNGSWNPILYIYVSIAFRQYNELFNPICFDPWNCPLKIWESIETPTPKVGAHLGVHGFIPSHSLTFPRAWNVTSGLHF